MKSQVMKVATVAGVLGSVASLAVGQWTDDASMNTGVVVQPSAQDVSKTAVDSDGSSWYGWFDFQPGGIQVRVQHLDASGVRQFDPAGLLVSDHPQNSFVVDWDLRVDHDGNCMLTFVDIRTGGDFDAYAYLIAPDGTFLWGPDGVTISDNSDFDADPRIIQLAGGDYIVVYSRTEGSPGIYMQRLSSDGTPQFATGGIRIIGDGSTTPAFIEVEPTADGDFVASWVRDITSFLSPRYVDAQRFDASGAPQWGSSPITVSDATVVPIAHHPRLLEDGAGGAIIAWHDTRDGDFDCYVQHIDSSGKAMFAEDGVSVSSEPLRQQLDPAIALDPSGDIMVFFRNTDSIQNIQGLNVQGIDANGNRTLGDSGIVLEPYDNQVDNPPRAATINGGTACLADRHPNSSIGDADGILEICRVDRTGEFIDEGPLTLSSALSGRGRLALKAAPGGALIAGWVDDRNGDADVFAQRMNADGTLGGPASCPADFNGDSVLNFFDVQAFLQAFSDEDPAADFNNDSVFNFFDAQAFLQAFSEGCP